MKQTIDASQGLKMDGDTSNWNNVTINQIQIVAKNRNEQTLSGIKELMWAILEALPEPKLKNLKLLATQTVIEKMRESIGMIGVARYLGFSTRCAVYNMKPEMKELEVQFSDADKKIANETVHKK